ncbi:MAG: hypothetical protein UV60_C0002G0020 [Parcubacteria group bacterium GW2011_GWA2_43_11]|nr:MAG: hypothetical protein UV60_C0002G0020 [Parcubacteria group bacterium GW2011_GWA2_43_11]
MMIPTKKIRVRYAMLKQNNIGHTQMAHFVVKLHKMSFIPPWRDSLLFVRFPRTALVCVSPKHTDKNHRYEQ